MIIIVNLCSKIIYYDDPIMGNHIYKSSIKELIIYTEYIYSYFPLIECKT